MASEVNKQIRLEIAHVLFIDIAGYSKLMIHKQRALLETLNQVVRGTDEFQNAEAAGRLIKIQTDDGMALVFYNSQEEPVECALEISRALKKHPELQLRMGIFSGPISGVIDVNGRANVAGSGINMAQRVMDCGDGGHILLSKRVAENLQQYRRWQPYLHELGECEVKHGVRFRIVNLYTEELGNPDLPEKFKSGKQRKFLLAPSGSNPKSAKLWAGFSVAAAMILVGAFLLSHRFESKSPVSSEVKSASVPSSVIPEKSVAVLPFTNMSANQENAFFADGMQDEILTDLAKIADLKVISRTSVMQYKDASAKHNVREIGEQLGVAHVLEGSVQRAANKIRVTAQLIDTRTDAHLWAEHYDRDLADVFAIQSEIAGAIAGELKAKLSPAEKASIKKPPTTDLPAYDLYLRAKSLLSTSYDARAKEEMLEAAQLLDRAVARDPSFLLAYCSLAHTHDMLYFLSFDHTPERLALADAAVQAALRLAPDSAEAHLARAGNLYRGHLDYDDARAEVAAARLLPNNPRIFELTGYLDRRQGRWDEALRNLGRALELDPRNFLFLDQISNIYDRSRRYPEATSFLDRALSIAPKDIGTRVSRAYIEIESRANTKPLHALIDSIRAEDPSAVGSLANSWLELALCERDPEAAARALVALGEKSAGSDAVLLNPRCWEGLVARMTHDDARAHAAFAAARLQQEQLMQTQPDYAPALCVLGLIDAGLGRKEDALREGRRAVQLLPVTKDSVNGALLIQYLAVIAAWINEKDLAFEQLAIACRIPGGVSYGQLKLHPFWDPLRGDSRFDKIVSSLAPKATDK